MSRNIQRITAIGLTVTATSAQASVIFVRASASGANDGTSWTDAYTSLQRALVLAHSGDEIWVAAATYVPGAAGNATASFMLRTNVALYGGFAGTESSLTERDPVVNVTTLSGDLDATTVNSYHVLRAGPTTVNAVLDGFVVRDGFANGTATDRLGAGLLMTGGSLRISDCTFVNNRAFSAPAASPAQSGGDGGGINCSAGQISFQACRFDSNSAGNGTNGASCICAGGGAGGHGGAVYSNGAALTFTDCQFVSNSAGNAGNAALNQDAGNGGSGGAIRAIGGSISISGCEFVGNQAGAAGRSGQDDTAQTHGGRGGAISLLTVSAPVEISACQFQSNATRNGRVANGGAVDLSTIQEVEIADCTFSGNSIGAGELVAGNGGAIYADTTALLVVRSQFDGNAAGDGARPLIGNNAGAGGAINAARSALTLVECAFSNNRGGNSVQSGSPRSGSGGAVFVGPAPADSPAGTPGPVSIRSCLFLNNRGGSYMPTFGTGGSGGAIHVFRASSTEIANCLVVANQAGAGATPGNGGGISIAQNATISNVTLVANTSSSSSGGGGLWLGATATVSNSILWHNTTTGGSTEVQQIGDFGAGDSINYSCVQGLSGGLGGVGNISADPLFVNAAGGNYRLAAGSPCIDAADNSAVPATITTDAYGSARYYDDPATADTGVGTPPIVDMGAAELVRCAGDIDLDNDVDLADLAELLAQFGASGPDLSGDVDLNGAVDLSDLALLLSRFGQACP